jgi:hypothetical protein
MRWLLAPPERDDLIRLLKAWRFWLAGLVAGALIGAAAYSIVPPPYRARATVVVDFNLEQAWPKDTDRQQFYYLERETRKLEELAWSDAVMLQVGEAGAGVTVNELRDDRLQLGQPEEGGWHFYADDPDPAAAAALASAWAQAFAQAAQENVANQSGLNSFIEVHVTQAADLPVARRVDRSAYMLAGSAGLMALSALAVLFLPMGEPERRKTKPGAKRR